MSTPTTLLPFQPATMSSAQLAAVSFLARSDRTHHLYSFRLREWFARCEGLIDSSVVSMMNGVRGLFRFAHIDGRSPLSATVGTRQRGSPPSVLVTRG